jgi:AmmeMemoRadiSam system protein B/AmmeMemoRadiSam system protein A
MHLPRTVAVIISTYFLAASACCAFQVKEPAVAGSFYPAEAAILKINVDRLLSSVHPAPGELLPLAFVVPHAGHIYSGAVAAEVYARLKGQPVSTVILIGPSHRVPLTGAAIYPGDGMRTPLGNVAINIRAARALVSDADHVRMDAAPFAQEHSLEVQLPFIQRALGKNTTIVPILVGSPDQMSFKALSKGISQFLDSDPKAVLIISTDLSHFHDLKTAQTMDNRVIDAMERLSHKDLERLLTSRHAEMCGGWPAVYGLAAARSAGATHAVRYRNATSGDVTGDFKSVVGYVSMGIVRGDLTAEQRKQLLELARTTVIHQVKGEKLPDAATDVPLLKADRATFVTINEAGGRLRGCIGSIEPQSSLRASVISNAASAATRDTRFSPVRPDELTGLQYEVTILSPLVQLTSVKDIVIGRHGLYLEKDGRSSVFLPQVPVEQGWDRAVYLAQLSLKAGLGPDGWKDARLSSFTAEVIK